MKRISVNVRSWPHSRYFFPILLSGIALLSVSATALYTHSDHFQRHLSVTTPAAIVVQKAAQTAQPTDSAAPTTPTQDTKSSTSSEPVNKQVTPTTKATPKSSGSSLLTLTCNDKVNSIYYNYNMSLAAENQHHKDELADIQDAYDVGAYDELASEQNDGATGVQLRDQDVADENVRYNAATLKLSTDEQSQFQASGCFGPH